MDHGARPLAMNETATLLRPSNRFACLSVLCGLLGSSGAPALAVEAAAIVTVSRQDDVLLVDATMDIPVPLDVAWAVLTDFDHMTSILGTLTSSKVTWREGNTLIVSQEGIATDGVWSMPFQSVREIRLDPMKHIEARNLAGTLKGMDSEATIAALEAGVRISYHAAVVPDSFLMRVFGPSFLRHELEEQFASMAREMIRRRPAS
jgi:hypothetical protein